MWYAHSEITCEPWIGDFNHAGYAILATNFECCAVLGKGASGKVFLITDLGQQASGIFVLTSILYLTRQNPLLDSPLLVDV